MDNDDLVDAISCLTEKLHGVGLEIYHLGSEIAALKNAVNRLSEKEDFE